MTPAGVISSPKERFWGTPSPMVGALARTAGSSKQPTEQTDATSCGVSLREGRREALIVRGWAGVREKTWPVAGAVSEQEEEAMLGELLLPCRPKIG